MTWLLRLVLLSVFLLVVASCGPSSSGLPSEWVAADSDLAVYLSWTATPTGEGGDTLIGTIHEVQRVGDQISSSETAFAGVRSGSSITLTVDRWLGSAVSITGTVARDQLTLRLPNPDGGISETTLVPGSVDGHNANVARLRDVAGQVAEQRAAVEQATAILRAREAEFKDAASALDQSFFDADANLSDIGSSIESAQYLLESLPRLVGDMADLAAQGPVDDYLREDVANSLSAAADTRTSIDETLDYAFSNYGIGPILETLPGNVERVQTAASALQQMGGDPDGSWPEWRSLVASVDDKVDEFTTRMGELADAAAAVRADADAQIERAVAVAASVGVEP